MAGLIKYGIPRSKWDSDRKHPWYSDYWDGKHRIHRALSVFKPKAQKLLDDMVALRQVNRHGGFVQNMSWYTFREKYMNFRQTTRKPRTVYADGKAIKLMEDEFVLQTLSQITPELLEQLRMRWQAKAMGPYAIAKNLQCLKTMMRQAEDWKFIGLQNWRTVKIRANRKRFIYYTVAEFQSLLGHCSGHWKTAALLMGRAGLRPEEVRHLEWSDINFADRIIHIRIKEHLDWKPKKSTEESPHERVIDMPNDLEAYLKSIHKRQGFVLGDFIKYHTYRQYFSRLAKKSGIKGFAYAFRHTYATHLISHGSTLDEVRALLGHTDPRSTQIYAHMMPHARRSAVDRLPPVLPA